MNNFNARSAAFKGGDAAQMVAWRIPYWMMKAGNWGLETFLNIPPQVQRQAFYGRDLRGV